MLPVTISCSHIFLMYSASASSAAAPAKPSSSSIASLSFLDYKKINNNYYIPGRSDFQVSRK
jgi:hypothetical protein